MGFFSALDVDCQSHNYDMLSLRQAQLDVYHGCDKQWFITILMFTCPLHRFNPARLPS